MQTKANAKNAQECAIHWLGFGIRQGYFDVKLAYRRTKIGPFWITFGMVFQVTALSLVFGTIFDANLSEYLPFVTSGLIVWAFITNTILEGSQSLINAESLLKQIRVPQSHIILRTLTKNLVLSAHNIIVFPIIYFLFPAKISSEFLLLVPSICLLILNLGWLTWILAIFSARYRDLPPIISSLVSIAFYVTPVMWFPSLISNTSFAHFLVGLNPLYHWLQIVRLPLIGEPPTLENWIVSVLTLIVGFALTYFAHRKSRLRIMYWI